MIQKIASNLTDYSIAHSWIDPSKAQWCRYALEKRLGMVFFAAMCCLLAAVTATWAELFSFVLIFYLFRQRLGGLHAKTFWSCQLISLGAMIAAVIMIGPILERASPTVLIGSDILLIVCTFFLKPVYPDSAHFSQAVRAANTKRKNQILLGLLLLQLLTLRLSGFLFLIYSFLGLAIADLSVLFQIHVQQKEG